MKFICRYTLSDQEPHKWLIDDGDYNDVQSMLQHIKRLSSASTGLRNNLIVTESENSEQTELCWYQIFKNGSLEFEWNGSVIFGDRADKAIDEWQTITPDYQDYCFILPKSLLTCYSRGNQLWFFAKGILYSGSCEKDVNEWKNYLIFP